MVQQSVRHPAVAPVPQESRTAQLPVMEALRVPPAVPPANHGSTVAAWTTTFVVLIGTTIAALAVIFAVVWLFWVGLAVAVAGPVVGRALQGLGYGKGGARTAAKGHGTH